MPDDAELDEIAKRIASLHAEHIRRAAEHDRLQDELVEILERLKKLRQHPIVMTDKPPDPSPR